MALPVLLLEVSLSLSIVQSLVLLLPITVKFQLDLFVRAMDGIPIQLLPDAPIIVIRIIVSARITIIQTSKLRI